MLRVYYCITAIGTASAGTNLMRRFQGMLKVFKELGINHGEYYVNFCEKKTVIKFILLVVTSVIIFFVMSRLRSYPVAFFFGVSSITVQKFRTLYTDMPV